MKSPKRYKKELVDYMESLAISFQSDRYSKEDIYKHLQQVYLSAYQLGYTESTLEGEQLFNIEWEERK